MAVNNDDKKKYTPTEAPELKAAPTVPTYDTVSWDNTSKGYAALGAYNDAKNALANQSPFVFSENEWLNSVKDIIKNYGKFSYDVNSDALYQQYAEQYARMGKMAMQDTMGQAAAMTGGYGNSYSASAGNQAYQSYIQQLNDKVPELYKLALDQHNMGKEDLYNQYGLLLSEYEREYGQHSDEYQKLLDALNIASSDYYNGADMYHTEQSNKNSALNQEFNNYMDIWQENNTNAWEQAKWDESLNQYANDEAWKQAEWDRDEKLRLEEKAATAEANRLAAKTAKANAIAAAKLAQANNTPVEPAIPDSVRQKVATFESNTSLANYLDGLEASGVISPEQADKLYAEYADVNEKYVEVDDGNGNKTTKASYSDMVKSEQGWQMVTKGGGNLVGIDANAKVKTPNGETMYLKDLRKKLVAEGMKEKDATNYIKSLQQALGISSNWLFGW